MSDTLRRQLLPFQPADGDAAAAARRLPDARATRSRRGWPPSPRCSPRDCRCVVSVSTDSVFDTHENQAPTFEPGLSEVAQTLYAFQRDLEARGLDGRVLTLIWSEFGRRPQQNASAGTDHGAAGCALRDGHPGRRHDDRRVAGPRERPRCARQPQRDRRLSRALLLAARAVARPRGGSRSSRGAAGFPRVDRSSNESARRCAAPGSAPRRLAAGASGAVRAAAGGRASCRRPHLQVTEVEYRLLLSRGGGQGRARQPRGHRRRHGPARPAPAPRPLAQRRPPSRC